MLCVGGCGGAITPLGTVEENIVNLMSPIVNAGIPLLYFTEKKGMGMMNFMFDRKEITAPDGSVQWSYVMKEGVGGNGKFQDVMTNSDCQLEWREQFLSRAHTTVDADEVASNTVDLVDITKLRGIGVGSKIEIYTGGRLIAVTIASILGNTVTLEAGVTVTVNEGDCVYRGAYNRSRDCDAKINNKYELVGYTKKISNFRNISLSLEFVTCDLSIDRFINYMGENGSMRFINSYKQAAVEGFVEELRSAFYTDRNLRNGVDVDGNTIAGATINETMGLFPEITRVQTALDIDLIVDVSGCCTGTACSAGNLAVVQSLMDIIQQAYESGLYTDNVVTLVGNHKFFVNMQKMQSAFQDFTGLTINYEYPSDGRIAVRQQMPGVIQLGDITVERFYDDYLNKYDEPLAVLLPKEQVYFSQKKYAALTENMEVTKEINANISTGFPRLRFIDRTKFDTNGLGDCYYYVSDFQYANVFAGIESGAYRVIRGFAPCDASCASCESTTNLRTQVV